MDKSANISQISDQGNIDEDDPLWFTPYRALQAAAKKLNIPANLKKQYLVDLITARELGNETVVKMLYDSAQKEKDDNVNHQKTLGKSLINHGKKISFTIKTPPTNGTETSLSYIKKDNTTQPSISSEKGGLKIIKISQVVSANNKNSKKDNVESKNDVKQELMDVETSNVLPNKITEEQKEISNTKQFQESSNKNNVKPLPIDSTNVFDLNGQHLDNFNQESNIENAKKLYALDKIADLSDANENCLNNKSPIFIKETSIHNDTVTPNQNNKVINEKISNNNSALYSKSSIRGDLESIDSFQNIKELKEKNNLHFIDDNALVNHDICLSENQYSTSEFLPSIDSVTSMTRQQYYDQNKLTPSHSLPDEQMKILHSILNSEPLDNICDQQSEFLNISDFNAGLILNKNNYCENPSDIKTLNSIYTSDFTKLHYNNSAENLINSLDSTMDHHQTSDNFANTSYSDCGMTENYLNSNHDVLQEYDNVENDDYNHFADALVENFSSIENIHFNSPGNITSKNFNMIPNDPQPNSRDDTDLTSFFNRYDMWKETFKPMSESADSVICFMCNWFGYIHEFYNHITKKHIDKITHTAKGMITAKINILKLASGLYLEQQQTIIERFNELYILRLKFKAPDTVCALVLRLSESSKDNKFPVIVHIQVTTNHSKKKLYWKGLVDDLIDPKRPTNVDIFANRKHGRFEVMLRELEIIPHDINENNIDFQGLTLTLNIYIQMRQDLLHY